MKKIVNLVFLMFLITGCTANYDLEITESGCDEKLTINATTVSENDNLLKIELPVWYDYEQGDESDYTRVEGVEYYNNELVNENGLNKLTYTYNFVGNRIIDSRIIRSSFSTVIFKKYDYDDDGKNDYMLISTTDDFKGFEYEKLDKVIINIHNNYKVISSNADRVNGNTYTWTFTRDNSKAINMVYDPSVIIDNRTMLEKFIDSKYFVSFILVSLLLFSIFIVFIFKIYSNSKDKV